jgi:hypothetical protein
MDGEFKEYFYRMLPEVRNVDVGEFYYKTSLRGSDGIKYQVDISCAESSQLLSLFLHLYGTGWHA